MVNCLWFVTFTNTWGQYVNVPDGIRNLQLLTNLFLTVQLQWPNYIITKPAQWTIVKHKKQLKNDFFIHKKP